MKLHLATAEGRQMFSGYGEGYVAVNAVRYERNVLVGPEGVAEWPVRGFESLTPADFEFIGRWQPEIVILGTGTTQRFPSPELARALDASGAGIEVMDSKAACRTYNILASEGRRVVAAVLIE